MLNTRLLSLACQDIIQGIQSWRIWLLLGWQDIRLRYRRSILGPFWITLSMAVMIYSMGFLYGKLFKIDLTVYYPFLASGLVIWAFIAGLMNEGCEAFASASGFIQQIKLPYSIYILQVLVRNVTIFFHNLVAIIPILIFSQTMTLFLLLIFVLNFMIILFGGFCYSFILCIIGTRFRDIKQMVVSITQLFFLLTPVIWMPAMLPDRFGFLAEYNPFFQMINLLRAPLTGHVPDVFTYVYMGIFCAIGFLLMILLLWRTRHRIAFWV
jgi:ABC-type polysaccharide/polyol phosphate export permease